MKQIIVITSGKGGVGKTTTAINLGAAMNHFGSEVLIIDGNLSTPNVGIHLGAPEVPVNLNHVLQKKAKAFEAIYEHDSGLKIMPSSLSISELSKIKLDKLEHSDYKYISFKKALSLLTYSNQRKCLRIVNTKLKEDTLKEPSCFR